MISPSNKKKKKRSASNTTGGVDPSIETFIEYDENMEFLLLDDVLPTDRSEGRTKINLRQEDDEERKKTQQGGDYNLNGTNVNNLDNTMATTNNGNGTPDVTLLSLGGVMSVSRGLFLFVCLFVHMMYTKELTHIALSLSIYISHICTGNAHDGSEWYLHDKSTITRSCKSIGNVTYVNVESSGWRGRGRYRRGG